MTTTTPDKSDLATKIAESTELTPKEVKELRALLRVWGVRAVRGDKTFNNDVTVDGDVVVGGTLDVTGNVDIDGDTDLDDTTVDGDLDVTGDTTLNGAVTLGDDAADTITVPGTATFNEDTTCDKDLSVTGDLDVDGTTTLDDTTVDGPLDITGRLQLNQSSTTISEGLDVSGISRLHIAATDSIDGLTGGVAGQIIHVRGTSSAANLTLTHNTGSTQDFLFADNLSHTFSGYFSITLHCSGTYWFVTGMADQGICNATTCTFQIDGVAQESATCYWHKIGPLVFFTMFFYHIDRDGGTNPSGDCTIELGAAMPMPVDSRGYWPVTVHYANKILVPSNESLAGYVYRGSRQVLLRTLSATTGAAGSSLCDTDLHATDSDIMVGGFYEAG